MSDGGDQRVSLNVTMKDVNGIIVGGSSIFGKSLLKAAKTSHLANTMKKPFKVGPSSVADQSGSPFFNKLPPEIRNRIMQLACDDTTLTWTGRSGRKVTENWTTTPWKLERYAEAGGLAKERLEHVMMERSITWEKDGKPMAPGLMLVCKQMYKETSGVFFFNTHFVFKIMTTYHAWLLKTEKQKLRLCRSVHAVGKPQSYGERVREKATAERFR